MVDLSFITEFIRDIGFPIAVTVYLLYERDRSSKALGHAIKSLELTVREMITLVKVK